MAAMRMKERSGPGMPTVSTAGEGGLAFGWSDGEAPEEQADRQKKAEKKMANVRRGHFIVGYLFENLRASRSL